MDTRAVSPVHGVNRTSPIISTAQRFTAEGQVITARVLGSDVDGTVRLQVGNEQFRARTQTPLTNGESVSLKVVQLGEIPILTKLTTSSTDPTLLLKQNYLRLTLPHQGSLTPLTKSLSSLLNSADVDAQSTGIKALAHRLISELPTASDISKPESFKQTVHNSGLFLENHLTNGLINGIDHDIKVALQKFLADLHALEHQTKPDTTMKGEVEPEQKILETLINQTKTAIARIEVNQLNSIHTPVSNSYLPEVWIIELPVVHDNQLDVIQLRVEEQHQPNKEQGENNNWSITISTDLDELGPLHARLYLDHEENLQTTLWAEDKDTFTLIQQSLDELREMFFSTGIKSANISCLPGSPSTKPSFGKSQLVDLTI